MAGGIPRLPTSVAVTEVVIVEGIPLGTGEPEDRFRLAKAFYSKDGRLLAYWDPDREGDRALCRHD